jgi:hypothetical protein
MRPEEFITRHQETYKSRITTHSHYAVIMQRGKLLASARNRVATRSRASGCNEHTMHAECSVIKALGDMKLLRGCIMIVYRLNKHSEIRNSMPCSSCVTILHKCMTRWGLRRVIYS